MDNNQENLIQELEAFQKEKEKIRKIVGRIGGTDDVQSKRINALLLSMIIILLFMGGVLKKLSLETSMYLATLVGIIKVIWIISEMKKANHFQYWILNSIEVRVNDMNAKVRKIEKMVAKMSEAQEKENIEKEK